MKKTALIIFSIIFLAGVLVVLSACSIKLPIIKQTPKIVNEVSKENNALAGVKNSEASAHQPSDLIANCDTDLNAPYENFCKTTEDCRALWKNICPSSETINFKGGKFDAKTFEMICDRYSTLWDAVVKDKNGVYLASTTQITGSDGKAKFNVDWIMVNSKTFKNLNCSYFIDNNQVLYAELPDFQVIFTNVLGADAITFETISSKTPSVTSNQYAKDKNHVYYAGLVITGADPSTFKILNSNYSEDKNNVYLRDDGINSVGGI
ncbi:MAG TPA: DKNYY domain-containing protein [Candidatus Nanoarchaeia archaeon]|nr:DKNYY domain-containing protein [Candidatus Nanoarchaeia archaeon]